MNFSPVNQVNFGRFGYYGKQGILLDEIYPTYSSKLKDSDVIYVKDLKGVKYHVSAGTVRTIAIQEKYPGYRSMFKDSDIVTKKLLGNEVIEITAGDIRKEFAQEEMQAEHKEKYPARNIDYSI